MRQSDDRQVEGSTVCHQYFSESLVSNQVIGHSQAANHGMGTDSYMVLEDGKAMALAQCERLQPGLAVGFPSSQLLFGLYRQVDGASTVPGVGRDGC